MTEGIVRVRLDFAYDGTDFSGWAAQPGLRTIQGVMEDCLLRIVRTDPTIVVAGRTDAGVHARGQVAHVDLSAAAWHTLPGRSHRPPEVALADRLNGMLPGDIVVRRVVLAPPGFDARFSATERRYSYRVSDDLATRDPLMRRSVFWAKRPLDIGLLREASLTLTGLRDFAAFCRSRPGATTIRNLVEFSWQRMGTGPDAGLVVSTVRADAFCHSMVRSLVGAVLTVGEGRRDLCWLRLVASSEKRTSRVAVAPPHGLTLEEVTYPRDSELASRAHDTRARRTLD